MNYTTDSRGEKMKSTTVIAVKHNGKIALGADGQATLGNTVAKSNVKKIRKLNSKSLIAVFTSNYSEENVSNVKFHFLNQNSH